MAVLAGLLHAAMWCGRSLGVGAAPSLLRTPHACLCRRAVQRHAPRAVVRDGGAFPLPPARGAPTVADGGYDELSRRFERSLQAECSVGHGATVLALVSGGRDSVALLHLLARAQPALGFALHVLHFNHQTRAECDSEEAFVRDLAERHNAAFHVRRLERVPESGLQAHTRAWRRTESTALLARLAGETASDAVIALGHHADDDVETILLKWLRGCHVTRLAGMRARDGPFVRPLLGVGKEALTRWLEAGGLEWREDSSNATPKYKRNRIRLELVPLLQQLTGDALGVRLNDLVEQGREARELLDAHLGVDAAGGEAADGGAHEGEAIADEPAGAVRTARAAAHARSHAGDVAFSMAALHVSLDVPQLLALPRAVQTEAIHRFVLRRSGRASTYAEVRRALDRLRSPNAQSDLHLAGGWLLRRNGNKALVLPSNGALGLAPRGRGALETGAWAAAAGSAVCVAHAADCVVNVREGEEVHETDETDDAPTITLYNVPPGSRLRVRARREGDTFTPAWRERPVKLKDFLRGQKVPLHARNDVRLIAWDEERTDGTNGQPIGAGRADASTSPTVLAVYPTHVGRACAHDEGVHPPVRLALRPSCGIGAERAPGHARRRALGLAAGAAQPDTP